MTTSRPIDALLAQYSANHANPVNETIHMVCVPAIVLAQLGMLWSLHPAIAIAAAVAALAYYFRLSTPFALGMLVMSALMLALLAALPPPTVLPLSPALFALASIGQFIGHQIEGKRPSFFDDLRCLLIGPLFVLGVLYRRLRLAY